MAGHGGAIRIYLAIFGALLVLTAVTVWVSALHLGPFNDVVALSIAVFKASLVVLFFMHVKGSSRVTKLVVVSGLAWLAILLALTLADYFTRDALPGATRVFY